MFDKLTQCEKTANGIEDELLTRYLAILNAKKDKISKLREQILFMEAGQKRKQDDDYGGDTDEEETQPKRKSQKKPVKQKPPSLKAMIDAQNRPQS